MKSDQAIISLVFLALGILTGLSWATNNRLNEIEKVINCQVLMNVECYEEGSEL